MATKAQVKASAKYDAENTVQVKIKLNKKKDADIISILEKKGNKQGYIKELIRRDAMGDDIRKKIYTLEYEGKISHEQGYRLLQLSDEGVDIYLGLLGRVDGVKRCLELSRAVREGDRETVLNLVLQTEKEIEEQKKNIENHIAG